MPKLKNDGFRKLNKLVNAHVLQKMARLLLPFYQTIARNRKYAQQWSKAVLNTDLDNMQKMLAYLSPAYKQAGLGSNAIGYFISFTFPKPINLYTNAITIPPGCVQFFFDTSVHRAMARSLVPFYQRLARNNTYALALARAIRANCEHTVNRLVRRYITIPALQSVKIQSSGIALTFKYSFSKYPYRFYLFRQIY